LWEAAARRRFIARVEQLPDYDVRGNAAGG
jgi:hypothetical protein